MGEIGIMPKALPNSIDEPHWTEERTFPTYTGLRGSHHTKCLRPSGACRSLNDRGTGRGTQGAGMTP